MSAVRTITLGGRLGREFGRKHEFAAANVAEAIRALCVMIPGFEKFLMESKDNGLNFVVMAGKKNLSEEEMKKLAPLGNDDITIMPILQGAKEGGVLQVVAGIVLIVVGAFITGLTYGWAAPVGNAMIGMGISMIVGGIVQMLSPQPKLEPDDKVGDLQSYVFNGAANVQAQGNCVGVLYGKMWTGSAVVSAGISAKDNYVVPSNPVWDGYKYKGGGGYAGDILERNLSEY